MLMLFLFWFIRILCLVCFILNIVIMQVKDIPSFIYFLIGLMAAVNIYGLGLVAHETYKHLPSLFILFRAIQAALIATTKCITWNYLAIHAGLDALVFIFYIIDNRYHFILVPIDEEKKTKVKLD